MPSCSLSPCRIRVALRKESVDRNDIRDPATARPSIVALRKESVDRNTMRRDFKRLGLLVALRKESVDRNYCRCYSCNACHRSLSARRAWIEIVDYIIDYVNDAVALRKESVDRNCCYPACCVGLLSSLSARRAWIEITRPSITGYLFNASLSARRAWIEIGTGHTGQQSAVWSLSARRAWIEIPAGCWRDARRAVALRKESVDRNRLPKKNRPSVVAVALRKESVDRNFSKETPPHITQRSLSARRAWIEIL